METMVSIIVPIYNVEKYVAKCIESILNQTLRNIQVILVNDGSTDKSLEICKSYEASDCRILLLNNDNEGVSAARNRGIKLATGRYIGFVDGDDYIDERMYEALVERIEKDKTDAIALSGYTINRFAGNDDEYDRDIINSMDALNYLFCLSFPTSLGAHLYRKESIKNIFLNEELHFFEDFEYNVRVFLQSKAISLCHENYYNYRVNEGSINHQTINDKQITCLNIYDDVIKSIKNDKRLVKQATYFRAYFLCGVILRLSKDYNNANDRYFQIIHDSAIIMVKDVLVSKVVPVRYKVFILMCSMHSRFAVTAIRILREFSVFVKKLIFTDRASE